MSDSPGIQLDVDFRNFLFMRGHAVRDTRDALTELITNAVDAYRNVDTDGSMEKYIYIYFHRVQNLGGVYEYYLQITDNATGVAPDRMRQCFLTAGSKTSSEKARGFFSTGAKNITVLGDTHFTSIVDGKISKVYLDDGAYGHVVTYDKNVEHNGVPEIIGYDVTETQRKGLGIPVNGMNATIAFTNRDEIAKFTNIDTIHTILTGISKVATLRDIFSDPKYHIITDIRSHRPFIDISSEYMEPVIHNDYYAYNKTDHTDNFGGRYVTELRYTYPEATLLSSTTFKVPNFEHYEGKFVLYKTKKPLPQPLIDNQMEFGFLIKDNKAIHEVNTLGIGERYRWNPYINYLFGYVHCDGFAEELKKYDNGETTELIIDPNRIGGINHEHPLYKSILTVCLPRLDLAMQEIENSAVFKSINIDELDTIINKLEDAGIRIFDDNTINLNFVPDKTSDTVIALKATENNIVREISADTNVKMPTEDEPVIEEIKQIANPGNLDKEFVYYVSEENNEIKEITVPATPDGDKLTQNIADELESQHVTTPYVFKMNDQGEWEKIKVFQRGTLNRDPVYDDSLIKIRYRSLTIKFINDINYKEKYLIDTTNGISIKINLHNSIVADKLSKTKIEDVGEGYAFKLSDEASYDALNFLDTLMTSIFTDIIVNNDIINNRIPMVDTGVSMAKRIIDHRLKIETNIEESVHSLFSEFIIKKRNQMRDEIRLSLGTAKDELMNIILENSSYESIEEGAVQLTNAIESSVMHLVSK